MRSEENSNTKSTDGDLSTFWKGFWKACFELIKGLVTPEYNIQGLILLFSFGICIFALSVLPNEAFWGSLPWGYIPLLVFAFISFYLIRRLTEIRRKGVVRWHDKFDVPAPSSKKKAPLAETGLTLKRSLTDKQKSIIQKILKSIVRAVAEKLKLREDLVRSNVFLESDDGMLRMGPELWYNIQNLNETTIQIPKGYGSTGTCFKEKKPQFAILREDWGRYVLERGELDKVDKRLRWILSVPIPGFPVKGNVAGVLNVDGLDELKDQSELETEAYPDVQHAANLLGDVLSLRQGH